MRQPAQSISDSVTKLFCPESKVCSVYAINRAHKVETDLVLAIEVV